MTRFKNKELIDRFVKGRAEDGDQANRMAVQVLDDEGLTLLWGYGWAVYGVREQDSKRLHVYNGWQGYSATTSSHMGTLRSKAKSHYPNVTERAKRPVVTLGDAGDVGLEMEAPEGYAVVIHPDADPSNGRNPDVVPLEGLRVHGVSGYSSGSRY